jgi:hypothetical protein
MHPDLQQFSSNRSKPSFHTLPAGKLDHVVGSAKGLSDGDVTMLADMYRCNTDRFFIQQGYRRGQVITSIQFAELAHISTSEIASTQAWATGVDQQKIENWIVKMLGERKWQLSFLRYMPKNEAFFAAMDTNRWSRRRQRGVNAQRYHISKDYEEFKRWLSHGHGLRMSLTDMASSGSYITGVMTGISAEDGDDPTSGMQQTVYWSPLWNDVVDTIYHHAQKLPPYAVTSMMQHSHFDVLGPACCGGKFRDENTLFHGVNMTTEECKTKCLEYDNCGALDIAGNKCTIFTAGYDCSILNLECASGGIASGVTGRAMAYNHTASWAVALTSNTNIDSQVVKLCKNEDEAIQAINDGLSNQTHPLRITSLVATTWGGYAVIMSATHAERGPPYWTPPLEAPQRYAISQPYAGFLL